MIRFPFSKKPEDETDTPEAADNAPAPAQRDPAEDSVDGGDAEALGAEIETADESPPDGAGPDGETLTLEQAASGAGAGFAHPDIDEQVRMIEALLFASEKPLSTAELASRMPVGCDAAVAVRRLETAYSGHGVQLVRVAGKWAFRTAPDLAHLLTDETVEQRKLSRAAIETLAIICYHQPVTRAEIEEIRQVGVSKGTIDLLMELEWVKLGRRRQTPGRPVTFVTTEKFLAHFGLENIKDLPRLEELRQAGLLDSRPPVGYAPPSEDALDQAFEEAEDEYDDDDERDQQDLLM